MRNVKLSAKAAKPAKPTKMAPAKNKIDLLIGLLRSPRGATIEAMMKASGWQAHSVRGALAGAIKHKGLTVTSEKADGARVYRAAP